MVMPFLNALYGKVKVNVILLILSIGTTTILNQESNCLVKGHNERVFTLSGGL